MVEVPMIDNYEQHLGPSKPKAVAQLKQLENRLDRNKQLSEQYRTFMQEYILLGHMRKSTTKREPSFFMPHHGVYKEESVTTKLRVVFNASSKTRSGYSLNDLMECGRKLHNDIQSLLINWRTFRYVYSADCEKMFRTILLGEEHQHLQKIMWRDEAGHLQEYQLCTVTYGTKAAPFLAMRTMQQIAIDDAEKYPLASKVLQNNIYVDDILAGDNNCQTAKETQLQLIDMLRGAGMNIRKWSSNTRELLEHLLPDQLNPSVVDLKHADSMKALGLHWDPSSDTFKFKNKLQIDMKTDNTLPNYTKRMMLSDMSKIFDPLGWLSPVVIKAKMLFQRVWATDIAWDDNIAEPILQEWLTFRKELTYIENIDIPRWIGDTTRKVQLHGFSDASEKALACSVYVRTTDDNDKQITRLLAAKTKLAPRKKPETLPRLELSAAVLLAKLIKKIMTSISSDIDIEVHSWTDSMVVLGWLHGDISRWKTFVANRVKQINDIVPASRWRHTRSEDNAADCATRGLTPLQLKQHSLWWEGPSWLNEEIPQAIQHFDIPKIDIKESKVHAVLLTPSSIILDLINKHSSLSHVVRIICWIRRFGLHIRQNDDTCTSNIHLTADEIQSARQLIIKNIQLHYFKNDIMHLSKGENLSSKSDILTLNPFMDDKGILRVGGRLRHSNLTYNHKHPILLPHDTPLTKLLINDAHIKTLHGGPALTLTYLREQYWIIGGIRSVKKQIRLCVKCRRFTPRSPAQIMADLPEARVTPSTKCFIHTGVDFSGYVEIKSSKGRGIKSSKAYIAVFVCFATKAVHLELVSDLSSEAFIAALKRMCARRGLPKHLYCDNGTNFVGASRILKKEYEEALPSIDTAFLNEISQMNITIHRNVPRWPQAGGLWEAAVKSVKFHLKRVIGEQKLTFEEFYTLLTQIEACLNSRPLYALSENIDDDYLTPGHFLTGAPLISSPLSDVNGPTNLRTRWHLVQQMQNSFWKRWSTDYLHHLQRRFKWNQPQQDLKLNDIVLIQEDNMPPSKWALGKVEETHPGKDGRIRAVTLKTKSGYLKRPIVKLTLLPVYANNDIQNIDNKKQTKEENEIPSPSTTRTRSRRPRRGKLCNFLISTFLLLMTFATSSLQQACNITELTQNNTLYFDKIADMRVVQDHWNMVIYYNMSMYWQSMTDIENYINHVKNISNNELTFKPIISQFEHELAEIQHYNELMVNKTLHHRNKRGLINGIGYLANSLFGVLDDRFAQQYENDIETVKTNENHLLAMFKNQTSILEAENNILKRNEAVMHQHFEYINQHLNNITHELNKVEKETLNIFQSIYVMATALSADVIISNARRIQETLLDTITNIHHGQIDMHLISPDQLKSQCHTISAHLPSELVLPSDNVREFYKLLHVRARMTTKYMIIEVKVPLLSLDTFELHRVISLPVATNGKNIYNFPATNHIAFNIRKDLIMPLTDTDIQKCIKYNDDKFLCHENHPIYNIHFKQSLCNINLFTNNNNQTFCHSEIRQCTDKWIKLQARGAWLFSCCEECSVRILCPGAIITKQLKGNGIIYIGQGCILKGDTFMIHIPYDYTNEIVLQPDIDMSKIPQFTSSLNELIHTPISDSEIDKIENHEKLFDEISDSIAQLKVQDLQQIQNDSTTHLTIIYSVLSTIVIGILLYAVFRCRRLRRESSRATELPIELTTMQRGRVAEVVYDTVPATPVLSRSKSVSMMSVDTATSPSINRKVTFENLPKP